MTGQELINLIHKLNAEDMEVFVGCQGYVCSLNRCDTVDCKVHNDDGTVDGDGIEKLLVHDLGYYGDKPMYREEEVSW